MVEPTGSLDVLDRTDGPGPHTSALSGQQVPQRWIPVRSLGRRHAPRILNHLLSLEPADRYLRFGYAASDEQIARYVESLDFARDEIFGIFNRKLDLIAMAHLALIAGAPGGCNQAEFGVSVIKASRGRGFGALLFDSAVLHARNRQVDHLIIHALSENTAMLRIVRRAGAEVVRDGSESEAQLRLPPENLVSHMAELLQDQAAEIDFHMKRNAQQFEHLLGLWVPAKGRTQSSLANDIPRP
jgi:GNAT superfamily N-acetyltransferase